MKELDLVDIRKIEIQILLHFKEFSKKNDIDYFVSNGTLLGAIKYKGFIPWDDDIDIFVPRNDYDRFIDIYVDNNRYKLFSHERDKNFLYPFAKLCDISTIKDEQGIDNVVELGLDIDIFPLDNWNDDFEKSVKIAKKISRLIKLLNFSKVPYSKGKNIWRTLFKTCILCILKVIGAPKYIKRICSIAKINQRQMAGEYQGCVVWPIYGVNEIIPKEVFNDIIEVEFEGENFSAPIGYDVYLRSLYGDYWEDPPLEKQKTHHKFKAYKISETS